MSGAQRKALDGARSRGPASVKRYLAAPEREQQIVKAAIDFVARRGFNFTTRELADSIDVTQPLLYRYFANKQALIDRIFKEVYLSRWRSEWNDLLRDRSQPFCARLCTYLRLYTAAILEESWVRIFIVSAFDDPVISRRYIGMLHRETFSIVIEEIAHEAGRAVSADPRKRELATEIVWGFHSSFFYMGIRKYLFRLNLPSDLEEVIRVRVDVFLDGALANAAAFLDVPE